MAPIPFTDTHVHFFDRRIPGLGYAWLDEDEPRLGSLDAISARRLWPEDFAAEARFQNVEATVHVQAALSSDDHVLETGWAQECADRAGWPNAIVAGADLSDQGLAELLDRHAGAPNLRGIRDIRDDDFLHDQQWLRGVGQVATRGLVLCVEIGPERFPAALELARAQPDLTLCIDHAGLPEERSSEDLKRWRLALRILAAAPNVVVKISGLGMGDHRWTRDSLRPWVISCIDCFGIERVFFGSNWPVDRLYSSYGDLIAAYRELVADFSTAEQCALLSDNGRRVFGLEG